MGETNSPKGLFHRSLGQRPQVLELIQDCRLKACHKGHDPPLLQAFSLPDHDPNRTQGDALGYVA